MLRSLVESRLGVVLDESQADRLAQLAREWLWWPLHPSEVPFLAAELLASGFSTQKLAIVAGLSHADERGVIAALFGDSMAELGLDWFEPDPKKDSALRCALCCEAIRRGAIRPTRGARYLAHSYFFDLIDDSGDVYWPLVALSEEWEESESGDRDRFDALILEHLQQTGLGGDGD